jgi:hypothetical protein
LPYPFVNLTRDEEYVGNEIRFIPGARESKKNLEKSNSVFM